MQSNNTSNQVSAGPFLNLLNGVSTPAELVELDEIVGGFDLGSALSASFGVNPAATDLTPQSSHPAQSILTPSTGQTVQTTSTTQITPMAQTTPLTQLTSTVVQDSAMFIDPTSSMLQAAEEVIETYGRAKAAGNAEQRKKKDVLIENRQLHEENQKLLLEKQNVLAENQKVLVEKQNVLAENQKLQAENCILNAGNGAFITRIKELKLKLKELRLKLKGKVCILDEMSYI